MAKRFLQVFRDGKKHEPQKLQVPLLDGEQGNFQTLQIMKEIVLADRLKNDLRRLVLRDIVRDVEPFDFKGEIKAIFNFTQKEIKYRKDPVQVERVFDLWTTLFGVENERNHEIEGDCGVKSVFMATCLALLGHRPFFVIIKQDKDAVSFNHIYNAVLHENKYIYLDATPKDTPITYQPKATQKFLVSIF